MQLSFWAIAFLVIAYMGVFLPGGGNMQGDGQMGFQLYIVDFDGKIFPIGYWFVKFMNISPSKKPTTQYICRWLFLYAYLHSSALIFIVVSS